VIQEVVELFRNFKRYDAMDDNELRLYLMPSMKLKQCMMIYDNDEVVGFANWAYLHDLVEKRYKETGKIKQTEWKSGRNAWLIEVVSIRNTRELTTKLYNYFKERTRIDDCVKWLRTDGTIYRIGQKHKREFHN
jgi:hemolysin-activating ACP:hemolysin acyltransferase